MARTREPSQWIELRIMVKVQRDEGNEAEDWLPTKGAVVQELRDHMEDLDLDTGWVFREFS